MAKIHLNSTDRPRIVSPLYEDGPWLKHPMKPHLFSQDNLGPAVKSGHDPIMTKQRTNRGGTSRAKEPAPTLSAVHQSE